MGGSKRGAQSLPVFPGYAFCEFRRLARSGRDGKVVERSGGDLGTPSGSGTTLVAERSGGKDGTDGYGGPPHGRIELGETLASLYAARPRGFHVADLVSDGWRPDHLIGCFAMPIAPSLWIASRSMASDSVGRWDHILVFDCAGPSIWRGCATDDGGNTGRLCLHLSLQWNWIEIKTNRAGRYASTQLVERWCA
jgi:hypothetical protein